MNMKNKNANILQRILVIVLFTNFLCFYPSDMIPLPLIIFEDVIIQGAFLTNFSVSEIGTKLLFIGQILLLWTLLKSNLKLIIVMGSLSVSLLMTGIPLMMDYRNISGWSFEFSTWIPFFLSGFIFLYYSIKFYKK